MKIRGATWWFVVLAGSALAAQAAEWKPVTGTYAITEKNLLDPSAEEPRDTHFRLQLTGAAASDLYQAMNAAAIRDECTGAGLKQIGDLRCRYYANDARYECDFSIDIARQKIDYGVPC